VVRFVNYLAYTCSILAVPLAIYLYFRGIQEREPKYYVSPERTRIIDTSVPAPAQLQVLYKGRDLNASVGAVVIYFWNDGKLPIKAEDVLEPLIIDLDADCEILDARVLKVSRSVTKLTKGEVGDRGKNRLPLSFSILEHNDGAAIQIIYSGKPDTTVSLSGTIVGAGQPRLLAPAGASRLYLRAQQILGIVLGGFASFALGTLLSLVTSRLRSEPQFRPRFRTVAAIFLITALMVGSGVLMFRASARLSPAVPQTIWLKQ